MTRRPVILSVVLLHACCHAAFITVPQSSASDYIFTVPAAPALIRGKVIDPDNPHGTIRYEDVAWLQEAYAERAAIASGSLPTPGSNVTERVSADDYYLDPLGWQDHDSLGISWLDGDAPLPAVADVRLGVGSRATTNVLWQTVYTNATTNALSVIAKSLTNGTVTVYTNSWRIGSAAQGVWDFGYRLPAVSPVTNVHAWTTLDYCHADAGKPFPFYTNTPSRAWGDLYPFTWAMWPSARAVAHDIAILRGTVRLADEDLSWTNVITITNVRDEDGAGRTSSTYTSSTPRFSENNANTWGQIAGFGQGTYVHVDVPTRFDSALVTTGGVVRVAIEATFATIYVSMTHSIGTNTVERLAASGVIRVDNGTLDLTGDKAWCGIDLSPAGICFIACAEGGVTTPFMSEEDRTSTPNEQFSWSCSITGITLLYRITPATTMPTW